MINSLVVTNILLSKMEFIYLKSILIACIKKDRYIQIIWHRMNSVWSPFWNNECHKSKNIMQLLSWHEEKIRLNTNNG